MVVRVAATAEAAVVGVVVAAVLVVAVAVAVAVAAAVVVYGSTSGGQAELRWQLLEQRNCPVSCM